jgi:hypothetical protein
MRAWRVRDYQDGDETDIVNLVNIEGKPRYDLRQWLWWFKNNPYGFLTCVSEHDGKIVGHMGLSLLDIKVGDQIIRASQASALIVHPDFRHQGMFLAIGKALMKKASEEGVLFTYGFPNEPAYRGHLKYGWFDVSMIPVLATYFNTYETTTMRTLGPLAKTVSSFVDYFFSKKRSRKFLPIENLRISQISRFDESINEFWNRVSKDYGVIVVRNSKYLNWKYFSRPDAHYNVLLAERDGQVEGYLVLYIRELGKKKYGYIIDVLCRSEDVFLNLLHRAFKYFSEKKVGSTKCLMLKNYFTYRTLKDQGFTPFLRRKIRLCARINSPDLFPFYRAHAKQWYVTYGDCDFI